MSLVSFKTLEEEFSIEFPFDFTMVKTQGQSGVSLSFASFFEDTVRRTAYQSSCNLVVQWSRDGREVSL